MNVKKYLSIPASAAVLVLFNIFGWNGVITFLVMLMASDILSGAAAALIFRSSPNTEYGLADSNVLFKGIITKLCFLAAAGACYAADSYLGLNSVTGIIFAMLVSAKEAISISKNVLIMRTSGRSAKLE